MVNVLNCQFRLCQFESGDSRVRLWKFIYSKLDFDKVAKRV